MPIYTRTGDKGTTSLFGGKRIMKNHELVDMYGSVDELNSWIGLLAAYISKRDIRQFLFLIQSDLLTIGSHLAGWNADLSSLGSRILEMEKRIDATEEKVGVLHNFILPGGSQTASFIHIARSICRRVERKAVGLAQKGNVDDLTLKYLNRLSDLLFMLARFINKESGVKDVTWFAIPRRKKRYM